MAMGGWRDCKVTAKYRVEYCDYVPQAHLMMKGPGGRSVVGRLRAILDTAIIPADGRVLTHAIRLGDRQITR